MAVKMIRPILVALLLGLAMFNIALAQSGSPLVGIPHMSDRPDGPEMQTFPAGTDKVYLVFDYETDGPVEIIAEIRSEAQQGSVIFTNRETYNGSGTANIEIPGPGSSAFPDGVYDTIIRFGEQRYITAGWEWAVGDVELPPEDTSGGQTVNSPAQAQPPAADTGVGVNAGQSSASPLPTQPVSAPGLSPIILIGVGVLVLFLVAVIVWAVRGFMTAA